MLERNTVKTYITILKYLPMLFTVIDKFEDE